MIRITCPYCGPRDHDEFSYVGDATKLRPAIGDDRPKDDSRAVHFDYTYLRGNPRGPHLEYWQHVQGCRVFVRVLRDTLTHQVLATGLPHDDIAGGDP